MEQEEVAKVAHALLKDLNSHRIPEDGDSGEFRGSRAVKFFLESGFAKDHKAAISLGKKLVRSGLARQISGTPSVLFEGTVQSRYALRIPVPSPATFSRKRKAQTNEKKQSFEDRTWSNSIQQSNTVKLPPALRKYRQFEVYRTSLKFYIVGSDKTGSECKLLVVDRMTPELEIREDPTIYTRSEVNEMMMMVKEGNQSTGGLTKIATAFGIIGFVRFLYGHYLILITARRRAGNFGPHVIWSVQDTAIVPLTNPCVYERAPNSVHNKQSRSIEARYTRLFCLIQLKQDFYFSYTYDLTRTLQYNMINADKPVGPPVGAGVPGGEELQEKLAGKSRSPRGRYIWNAFLQEPLVGRVTDTGWRLHLIHGYFEQTKCSVFGRQIALTLIARRSRLFAGTRYLKRGVSNRGQVANDVEVEQIVNGFDRTTDQIGVGRFSSYVQNRASIPLFWTQQGRKMVAKPEIVLQKQDPLGLTTGRHFMDLFRRYGSPVLAVNLVRQHEKRPRESIIGRRFGTTVELLNRFLPDEHKIAYLAWDYKRTSTSLQSNVMDELAIIAEWALQRNGLFCSHPLSEAIERHPEDTHGLSVVSLSDKLYLRLREDEKEKEQSREGPTTFLYPGSGPALRESPMNRKLTESKAHRRRLSNSSTSSHPGNTKGVTRLLGWLGEALVPASPRKLSTLRSRDVGMQGSANLLGSASRLGSKAKPAAPPGIPRNQIPPSLQPGLSNSPKEHSWQWSFDDSPVAENDESFLETAVASASTRTPTASQYHNKRTSWSVETVDMKGSYKPAVRQLEFGEGSKEYQPPPSPATPASTTSLSEKKITRLEPNVCFRQRGVMRVNCIDSLDRTNVAQFCVGKCALGYQLHGLGMALAPRLERDARVIPVLLDMYERMGDRIAMQYGGSEMHRQMANDKTASTTMSPVLYYNRARPKTKEMMIAFMRHYQNTCQDNIKQDALNLLLGLYKPTPLDFNPKWSTEDTILPPLKQPRTTGKDLKPSRINSEGMAEKNLGKTVLSPADDHPPAPTAKPPPCPSQRKQVSPSVSSEGRLNSVSEQREDDETDIAKAARKGKFLSSTCKRFQLSQSFGFVIEADAPASASSSQRGSKLIPEGEKDEKGEHNGLQLVDVDLNGQAALLGVQPGWVVDAVGGVPTKSPMDFHKLISASKESNKESVVLRFRMKTLKARFGSQVHSMSFSRSVAGNETAGEDDLSDAEDNDSFRRMSAAKRKLLDNPEPTRSKDFKSDRTESKSPENDVDKKSGAFGRLGSWFRGAFAAKKQQPTAVEETWEMRQERAHWQKELAKLETAVHLWELNSDYYFHNDKPGTYETIGRRSFLETSWWKQPINIYEREICASASVSNPIEKIETAVMSKPEESEDVAPKTDILPEEDMDDADFDHFSSIYPADHLSSFDSMLKPGSTFSLVHTTIAGNDLRQRKRMLQRRRGGIIKRAKSNEGTENLPAAVAQTISSDRFLVPKSKYVKKMAGLSRNIPSDLHYRLALPSSKVLGRLEKRWSEIRAAERERIKPQNRKEVRRPDSTRFSSPHTLGNFDWKFGQSSRDPDHLVFRKYLSWTRNLELKDHLVDESDSTLVRYNLTTDSTEQDKTLEQILDAKLKAERDRSDIHGETDWDWEDGEEFVSTNWPLRESMDEKNRDSEGLRELLKSTGQRDKALHKKFATTMGSGSTYIRYTRAAGLLKKDLSLLFQHSNQTVQADDEYYTHSNSLDTLVPFVPRDHSDFYRQYLVTTVYPPSERRPR